MIRILLYCLLLFTGQLASAHEALPITLTLNQIKAQQYDLYAQVPPVFPAPWLPTFGVAAPCEGTKQGAAFHIRCPEKTASLQLTIDYPGPKGTAPIILRAKALDGTVTSVSGAPGATQISVSGKGGTLHHLLSYFETGLHHIISGYDHLLFLICLMLIARTPRSIFYTVTAFTAGHALTITLASLGVVLVDTGTVEVLIALSIMFAAAEVIRNNRQTFMWRMPWISAILFGLLHGLGFANVLREIGLPSSDMIVSLVAFNIGIEVGQLVFVLLCGVFVVAVRQLGQRQNLFRFSTRRGQSLLAYPIGIIASVWFFSRLISL